MEKIEKIFRAYDIRGIFGKDLTLDIAYDIGRAFGTKLGEGKKVCVSRDTRISGKALMEAFILGLIYSGCNSVKTGIIPIPVLGYYTWKKGFDAGVYISASHNPFEYNGIRFRGKDGAGLLYEKMGVKEAFMKKEFKEGKKEGYSIELNAEYILDDYFGYVKEKVNLNKKIKVVLDPGNGSAYRMLPLYENIGCEIYGINTIPNGKFPGRGPEPNKESLVATAEMVRNMKADFGVAFDADADRGIIMDNKGRIITPEKIAVVLAKNLFNEGKIVASVDCSILLEKELEDFKIVRERVGDIFISQAVKKHDAIIGVERSGHFFIPAIQYSDDPFAMSVKLAEVLSKSNKSLSELADEIKEYPYYSESIKCPDEIKFDVMEKIKEEFLKEKWEIDLKDGIRVFTDDWAVLIRASQTEPKIRLYIETTVNNLKELEEEFKKRINKIMKEMA